MALPTSGTITLDEIHVEAGGTTNTTATINDTDIRALIGKASGATMSFSEWYGASGSVTINLTIGANTNNYNIQNSRGGTYVAGATTVNLTINSGVTVGSTSTGAYALETGSISNVLWKVKRNGQGTETSYTIIPSAPDKEPFDWAEVKPYPLELALRNIPYAEQEAFYLGFDGPSTSSATNIDW